MRMHTMSLIRLLKEVLGTPKEGAEVGVFRGENAEWLLKTFPDLRLSLIDTWKAWEEDSLYYRFDKRMGRLSKEEWEAIYDEMKGRTGKYYTNVYRMESERAAEFHLTGSLDFVFLDAQHVEGAVAQDIKTWVPKVRSGGLICGHDYGGFYKGVKRAVDAFFSKHDIIIRSGRIWGVVLP